MFYREIGFLVFCVFGCFVYFKGSQSLFKRMERKEPDNSKRNRYKPQK